VRVAVTVVQLLGIAMVLTGVFLGVWFPIALIINGAILAVTGVLFELASTRKENLDGPRRPVSIR
jgi:hypothetical protein